MLKKVSITILLFLCIMFSIPTIFASASEELLKNTTFDRAQGGIPASWSLAGYHVDDTSFIASLDRQITHDGNNSLHLQNLTPNDIRIEQIVSVEPSQLYHLSGWIKAQGLSDDQIGANLSVFGTKAIAEFQIAKGSNWQFVQLFGKTAPDQKDVIVSARLGFYDNVNQGEAYFNGLSFKKVDHIPNGVIPFSLQLLSPEENRSSVFPATDAGGQPKEAMEPIYPKGFFSRSMIVLTNVLFIGIALLSIWYFRRNTNQAPKESTVNSWFRTLLILAFIVRIIMAPLFDGYHADVNLFEQWAQHAYSDGLFHFYSNTDLFIDYPPGYVYVLFLIGACMDWFHLPIDSTGAMLVLKIPPIICDVLIGFILYRASKKVLGTVTALLVAALFWFNPAVLINSAVWAQVDAVYSLFIALFLIQICRKQVQSASIFLAIAVLIKPQALLFGLIYFLVVLYFIIQEKKIRIVIESILLGIVTFLIGILPFVIQKGIVEQGSIFQGFIYIFNKYLSTLSSYPYASVNAFNIHAMFENNWVPISTMVAGLSINAWGWIGIIGVIAFTFLIYLLGKSHPSVFAVMSLWLMTGFFTIAPKMHERYLYPAMVIALVILLFRFDRRVLWIYLGISAAHYANVAYVLGYSRMNVVHIPAEDLFVVGYSCIQTALLLFTGWVCLRIVQQQNMETESLKYVEASQTLR